MNLKTILIAVAIVGAIYGAFRFVNDYFVQGEKLEISDKNNEELIADDSATLTALKLTKKEFSEYVSKTEGQLKGYEEKIKSQNIKLKHVLAVSSTRIAAFDTVPKIIEIDSFLYNISKYKPFKTPFIDKGKCFQIEGDFLFDGVKGYHVIKDRRFNDTTVVTRHKYRKKHFWLFGIPSRIFGRQMVKETQTNTCTGETKTVHIEIIKD